MFHRKKQSARILVIDDDTTVLIAFRALLERAGYQVRTAGSALEGLETARVWSPEAILLDIRMPNVNGLEALELLRVDPASREALIIAFSGHLGPADVARVRRLGFDGLVEKGGEPLEALRSLRDALAARSLVPELSGVAAEALQRRDVG